MKQPINIINYVNYVSTGTLIYVECVSVYTDPTAVKVLQYSFHRFWGLLLQITTTIITIAWNCNMSGCIWLCYINTKPLHNTFQSLYWTILFLGMCFCSTTVTTTAVLVEV